ncbi:hypothetical protein Hdeb2414_s0002g00054651 [Helianthus debilis subsp. tardiflorus]
MGTHECIKPINIILCRFPGIKNSTILHRLLNLVLKKARNDLTFLHILLYHLFFEFGYIFHVQSVHWI